MVFFLEVWFRLRLQRGAEASREDLMHDRQHLQSILKSHHEEHITDTHTPGWKDERLSETNADLEGDVAF